MKVAISSGILSFLTRHAEREYPRESCAVLLGRDAGQVNVAVRCANVHPEPLRHYAIDPRELIRLQRVGRGFGIQIVGFHHSHPDHEALPSETDLAEANWADCVYLITSVRGQRAFETRGFRLYEGEQGRGLAEMALNLAMKNCQPNRIGRT